MAKATQADAHAYRSLNEKELTEHISDEELRLKKLRFSHAVNPIENPLSIRTLRRRIAQLKTEQRARIAGK